MRRNTSLVKQLGLCCVLIVSCLALFLRAQDAAVQDIHSLDAANCTAAGYELCSGVCFDPASSSCVANTTICALNATELCGDKCYNSTMMTCHMDKILCGFNESLCGYICLGEQQVCREFSVACNEGDWLCRRTLLFIERFFEQILLIVRNVWNTVRSWDWLDLFGQYTRLFSSEEQPPEEEIPSDVEQPGQPEPTPSPQPSPVPEPSPQPSPQQPEQPSTGNRCDGHNCPSGEICCDDVLVGPLCYLPGTHTCTPVGNNQTRYCCCPTCLPCGEDYRCYRTESHQCVNGVVEPLPQPSPQPTPSPQPSPVPEPSEEIPSDVEQPGQPEPTPSPQPSPVPEPSPAPQPSPQPEQPQQPTNRCETTNCPEGEICCDDLLVGPLCYQPGTHTCTPVGPNNQTRYCCCPTCLPCGDDYRCYRTESHQCINGTVVPIEQPAQEIPFCFSQPANDENVCSGHGQCNDTDTCVCFEGWTGAKCDIPVCASNCSGHGQCTAPNTCSCEQGWTGEQCETPVCESNCSGHGQCTAPNTCSCEEGWTGEQCETMVCNPGYTGPNCDIPICFSQQANDQNVCSGNGQCVGPDNCTCNAGFAGDRCQVPVCFSQPANDANVCSGHGECTAPDTCICSEGWTGAQCETPICASNCSGHGQCTAPNTCSCEEGWTGEQCDTPICASNCSGHGQCTAPNTCSCEQGWTGEQCETMVCNPGYTGPNCDIPVCFGLSSTDSQVCSGNGQCVGPDQCQCNPGFVGDRCQNRQNKCDTTNCPEGEICCDDILVGPLCYKPGTHTCTPVGNNQTRYCCCPTCLPCGSDYRCYRTETHQCVNGQVVGLDNAQQPQQSAGSESQPSSSEQQPQESEQAPQPQETQQQQEAQPEEQSGSSEQGVGNDQEQPQEGGVEGENQEEGSNNSFFSWLF